MKRIILIFAFLCFGLSFAQYVEAPQYEFSSTSSYKYTEYRKQYTVPVSELQQPFYNPKQQNSVPIRKAPGYQPGDPGEFDTPIGDPNIYMILIMLFSYFIYNYVKKRRQQFLLYT
jgi:hypothetical protein